MLTRASMGASVSAAPKRAALVGDIPGMSLLASAVDERALLSAAAAVFATSRLAVALTLAATTAERARVLWVNAAFERLSGYSAAQVVGHPATVLAGAHVDRIHMSEVELLRDHPEQAPFGIVTTKQRPNGSWYHVEEQLFLIRNRRHGSLHGLLVQTELTPAH